MAVDQELLEILACPLCKEEVKLVPLADARRTAVRDKFRDKFRGVLVLCDPRLTTRAYGKLFLKSLPPLPITRELTDVQRFFGDGA